MLLYIYIYNPPFIFFPVSPKFALYLFFIPILLNEKFYKYVIAVKYYIALILFVIFFSFLREINNPQGFVFFVPNLMLVFEIFIIPIGIIMFYNSLKREDLILDVIKVATVAGLITLTLILNSSLSDFVRYSLLKNDEFTESLANRTFGVSESLTFSYGLIQGLMVPFVLFYSKKNAKILYTLPLFFISVLFNARIGFLPILLGLILYFILNFKVKQILFLFFGGLVGYLLLFQTKLFEEQKQTIEWGLDFFTQLSDFSSGQRTTGGNTFDTLFGDMLVLPENGWEWLFGTGRNIFVNVFGESSDVGYIIQLAYGGIMYISIFGFILYNLFKFSKVKNSGEKYLGFLCIAIMLIANIKGNFFTTVGIFRLMVLVIFWFYFNNRFKKNPNHG
ncbi:hypothetical protein [Pedobacter nototheniae]|uniref:hypothetical protein n=1 Tax=Pedobacter nototheniae TaxID=2488994 RepID=UPI0029313FFA|nr:hypothetical protein [Pedobacter nototheniae]